MTLTVQGAFTVTDPPHIPHDDIDDNWVRPGDSANPPATAADLRALYGTADPDELAARFAHPQDVATARDLAGAR